MVRFNSIIQVIEEEIEKCKVAPPLKDYGKTGRETQVGENTVITYDDGMQVTLAPNGEVLHLTTPDGFDEDLLGSEAYDFFEGQKEAIIDKYGEEGWDTIKRFSDEYACYDGLVFNKYIRGEITLDEARERANWVDDFDYMVENYEPVMSMLDDVNDLSGYPPFYTVRVANNFNHGTDSLDKKIVYDKGHSSATVGGDFDKIKRTFARDPDNYWTVITVYDGTRPAKGSFLGNPLMDFRGRDWEAEVNTRPNDKFERFCVDEEHHIVYQYPYTP